MWLVLRMKNFLSFAPCLPMPCLTLPTESFFWLLGKKKRGQPHCLCPHNSILGQSSSCPSWFCLLFLLLPFLLLPGLFVLTQSTETHGSALSSDWRSQQTLFSYECRTHTNRSFYSGVFLPRTRKYHYVWFICGLHWWWLWADFVAHPENCLCPHSSCTPLHSNFPSAVDIWMFFLHYFDMYLLDKSLQPSRVERRMKFIWLFPLNLLSHFQHAMNWNVSWLYLKKNIYWKHERGLYVYHYLDTTLCENDK